MGSPAIFNGTRTKLLTANGLLLSSGRTIDFDGLRNYIANNGAEINATGFNLYSNTAANIPSSGTGGTATGLTLVRSTTAPLAGLASLLLTQANSTNVQGKGFSYDFTLQSCDLNKQLTVSFDFNATSTFVAGDGTTTPLNDGTTSVNAGNSDVEIFLYDVSAGTLIYVSPQTLTSNGSGNYTFTGVFPTPMTNTSLRLIFHVARASANATGWQLKVDNLFVGRGSLGTAVQAAASRYFSATAAITNSYSVVTYTTVDYDNTGAYSGGTYTIPSAGKYFINASLFIAGAYTTATAGLLAIYKNGVEVAVQLDEAGGAQTETNPNVHDIINCSAGDLITIRVRCNATSPTVVSSTTVNFLSIINLTSAASTVTGPRSQVIVSSGNSSNGSTNTRIRRFTVTEMTIGTDITYADSATLGGSFTINSDGVYAISYTDDYTASRSFGISVNGTALSTNIQSITYAQGKRAVATNPANSSPAVAAWTGFLAAGAIVRAQNDGGPGTNNDNCMFTITKVSN